MWPFSRNLEDVLSKTKDVRIHGVKFKIKKIDPTAYLDGSKAMLQAFDIYKMESVNSDVSSKNLDKIKDHFKDVFMASVVSPKLCRKKEDSESLLVDNLFTEWDLANQLYESIISYTYGKKK